MSTITTMDKFTTAMQSIYGQFTTIPVSQLSEWKPPEMAEGHRRYLWTDAFGVVNFLTLHKNDGRDSRYLILANRLIHAVHSTLGRTRDLKEMLPGATETEPLKGGLRIGKKDEEGVDGDGQYFHYLTIWMFALNRMTVISGDPWHNNQAVSMAKSILPKFMTNMSSSRPRMFWKMNVDLTKPLVKTEGSLDPIDGYVMYNLLQTSYDDPNVLSEEIGWLKKIVDTKWRDYSSSDALDLGMTLWTAHWLVGTEEWAKAISRRAMGCLKRLIDIGYFDMPINRRLAFREFGTAVGVKCAEKFVQNNDTEVSELPDLICRTWENAGVVPEPKQAQTGRMAELMPITAVMYATALVPGVMSRTRVD